MKITTAVVREEEQPFSVKRTLGLLQQQAMS